MLFVQVRGNWYNVETGRKDGMVLSVSEVIANFSGLTIPVLTAV